MQQILSYSTKCKKILKTHPFEAQSAYCLVDKVTR